MPSSNGVSAGPKNDGILQHDVVRKKNTRDAAGRVILETLEVANESAAGGRGHNLLNEISELVKGATFVPARSRI